MLPVHSAGDAAGAYMMETATTAVQESRHDLVLEVSANRANDFKVYLPFCDDYLKGTVDWGDGTVEKVEGWNMYGVSHQYETNVATTYEVRFRVYSLRLTWWRMSAKQEKTHCCQSSSGDIPD